MRRATALIEPRVMPAPKITQAPTRRPPENEEPCTSFPLAPRTRFALADSSASGVLVEMGLAGGSIPTPAAIAGGKGIDAACRLTPKVNEATCWLAIGRSLVITLDTSVLLVDATSA